MAEFYTVRDLTERLKVTRQTVCNWTKRGLLPAPFKIGRAVRYPKTRTDAKIAKYDLEPVSAKLAELDDDYDFVALGLNEPEEE